MRIRRRASTAGGGAGHAQAHVFDGADHTVAGQTEGAFLRATGATGFAFEQVVVSYDLSLGAATWTNLPAAVTEPVISGVVGTKTVLPDLSRYTQCRMVGVVGTAGVTGDAKLQYSTDDAAWVDLVSTLIDLSTTGIKATAWEAIPAGAQADLVVVRLVALNGNTTEDPAMRGVALQVR
jgi:hypothetical protein